MKTLNALIILTLIFSSFILTISKTKSNHKHRELLQKSKGDYTYYSPSGDSFNLDQTDYATEFLNNYQLETCTSLANKDDFFSSSSTWCHKLDDCMYPEPNKNTIFPITDADSKLIIQAKVKGQGFVFTVGANIENGDYEYKITFDGSITTISAKKEDGKYFTLCEVAQVIDSQRSYKYKFTFDSIASQISLDLDDDPSWICPDQPWNYGLRQLAFSMTSDSLEVCYYKIQSIKEN
jgi:hypothetical protein